MSDELKTKALEYHSKGKAGKIEVIATKPCKTADDLIFSIYSGCCQAVLEIAENPNEAYKYTSKGNLVAVISNGTAILGLGNRGAWLPSLLWKERVYYSSVLLI